MVAWPYLLRQEPHGSGRLWWSSHHMQIAVREKGRSCLLSTTFKNTGPIIHFLSSWVPHNFSKWGLPLGREHLKHEPMKVHLILKSKQESYSTPPQKQTTLWLGEDCIYSPKIVTRHIASEILSEGLLLRRPMWCRNVMYSLTISHEGPPDTKLEPWPTSDISRINVGHVYYLHSQICS